jgi:hypothetical protein
MAERHNSAKLSHVDAVTVVVLCLLLILLVPLLFGQSQEQMVRQACAANLGWIGKSMQIYANDYEDELPRAGGRVTTWGPMPTSGWYAANRAAAYGLAADGTGGTASISSCFYLLVKYAELSPRVLICKGDRGTTEYARKSCSYSYHIPFNQFALKTSNDPNLVVAADRSPWISSPATSQAQVIARWSGPPLFMPDVTGPGVSAVGTSEQARQGNAIAHQSDGQNVLFLSGQVRFAERAYCSIEKDNIYTVSTFVDRGDIKGVMPMITPTLAPNNRKDSLLVHDPNSFPGYRRR